MRRLVIVGLVAAFASAPAHAGEGYKYHGVRGFGASFYLVGGEYHFYLNAALSPAYRYSTVSHSCLFGGVFERVWPTREATKLGGSAPISRISFRIDLPTFQLPPGLYHLTIVPLTDCDWDFMISSTANNTAGVAPVQLSRRTKGGLYDFSDSASLRDTVQFYAQVRTDHDAKMPVTGTMQIIHDGQVVHTAPLILDQDPVSRADVLYQDFKWDPSDAKYVGRVIIRYIVKIGSAEFTSTGEFTLTAR